MKRTLPVILACTLVLLASTFALDGLARKNAQESHVWLMETLLPGAHDFVRVAYTGEDDIIRSVHKADAGYVIETVTYGYAGEIRMMIGVDNAGTVCGLVVADAKETYGLGSRILTDHEFLSRFLNKSGTFAIGAPGADAFSGATDTADSDGNEIYVDGISGATVSSKAVARCVSAAAAYVTGADIESSATSWGA